MEIVEMDAAMNEDSHFSEEQRNKNYNEIADALEYIENGNIITEEFLVEIKRMIVKWREWIPDYSTVNEDNETEVFRQKCKHIELLISELCRVIHSKNTVDMKLFKILLRHMKYICDTSFEDDGLTDMLNSMTM
jgi:hypothetical protein